MGGVLDALTSFFSDTAVGNYWCHIWIGCGILLSFLLIYDNLRK